MNSGVTQSLAPAQLAVFLPQIPAAVLPSGLRLIVSMLPTTDETAVDAHYWQRITAQLSTIHADPCFKELSPIRQLAVAHVLEKQSLSISALQTAIEQHRSFIRTGHMRRSDAIETLTALLLIVAGHPIGDEADVQRIHFIYERIKNDHWWPSGPEDLPLCALIAALPGEVAAHVRMIEQAFSQCAEQDEVPGDPLNVVLQAWSGSAQALDETIAYTKEVRTGFILSGIPLRAGDDVARSRLSLLRTPTADLLENYSHTRADFIKILGTDLTDVAAVCAADTIILANEGPLAPIYRAGVLLRTWMAP